MCYDWLIVSNAFMKTTKTIYSIILAGGSGERMGGLLKQFLKVNKKPIIFYSIDVFLQCPFVEGIIVVVPRSKIHYMRRVLSKNYPNKKIDVIAGGQTRRASSHNALTFIEEEKNGCDYVIFHDGVRPLVTKEMVNSVVKEAKKHGAAILGARALNVIVTHADKKIVRALNAEKMYNTQTPHCYRFELIKKAHESKRNQKSECERFENIELVQSIGGEIKLIDSFYRNMKLTFSQDIIPLSALLKKLDTKNFFSLHK